MNGCWVSVFSQIAISQLFFLYILAAWCWRSLCVTLHTSMKDFLQDVELHPHKNSFLRFILPKALVGYLSEDSGYDAKLSWINHCHRYWHRVLKLFRYCCSYQSNLRMNDKPQCYNNTIITPISAALLGETKSISRRNFLVKVQEGRRAGGLIMIEVFLLKRLIFSCDAANLFFVGPVSYDVLKDI